MNPCHPALLLLGLGSLSGCIHAGQAAPAHAQDVSTMTASTPDLIHTLDEYPELTPEGMGRRFLKYLDSLASRKQLTAEFLAQQMGVELTAEPWGAYFTMQLPDSKRQYAISYYVDGANPPNKSTMLWFSVAATEGQEGDMAPVCGMDFDAYRMELEKIGYADTGREDIDHWGRLPFFYFRRGEMVARIMVRRESGKALEHLCVEMIDVGYGG